MPGKTRPHPNGPENVASPSRLADQALLLIRLGLRWEESIHRYTNLRSINVYPPSTSRNGMWLCIGKGWVDGTKVVTFYRSTNLLVTLLGLLSKISDGTAQWKPDSFSEREADEKRFF